MKFKLSIKGLSMQKKSKTKIWLSFEEQLVLLHSRGMIIGDEARAISYLERIGYYRLSGYFYPFRQYETPKTRRDEFVEGTRFSDIINLFVFDKKLRLLALDALERIELALRVDIAYLLGEKDPLAHLDQSYFSRLKSADGCLTHFDKWKQNYHSKLIRARKDIIIQHHKNLYQGNVPIWVAIEVWDFGTLSNIYALLRQSDKLVIAKKYGGEHLNAKYIPILEQWLRSLNYIRNVSAHHARLWNINLVDRSDAPNNILGSKNPFNNKKPFYYFAVMKQMLDMICPNSSWGERFKMHLKSFPENLPNQITLAHFGLLQDWETMDIWQKKPKPQK